MTDGIGTTTFNYDYLNRLYNVIYPGNKTIDYAYDDVGNQTGITTAFGTVSYAYDDTNQLSNITLPNLNTINYQYDNAGNLSTINYPNGTYSTYGYDTRNRLTGLSNNNAGGIISQYAYVLDGIGNRTNVIQQEPLNPVPNPVPTNYSYSTGNLLTTANGTTYGYDSNGNLTSKTSSGVTTTYGYDSLDRFISFVSPSFNIQYQYDGINNRVSKTVNATTTNYLVDSNGFLPQVVEEMDGSNNITSYYVHDRIGVIAKVTSSGNTYFYHYNGLGSTIAITDSNGNMVNKYAYDEFGNVLSQQETISNPYKYVGLFGVMDEGNGLLYMRARYYDPVVGRFINKDPIGLDGGINLFNYTGNNPVNNTDPSGLLIYLCGRKGHGVPGNHAYLWDDRPKTSRANRSCSRTSFWPTWLGGPAHGSPYDRGPGKDPCNKVLGSEGKEDIIMKCCREHANDGFWDPPRNDCFTASDKCIETVGLINPGAPVTRTEKICNPFHGATGNY